MGIMAISAIGSTAELKEYLQVQGLNLIVSTVFNLLLFLFVLLVRYFSITVNYFYKPKDFGCLYL